MNKEEAIQIMSEMEQLRNISHQDLEWLYDNSEEHIIEEGEYLMKKGDPTEDLTVILKGTLSLQFEQNGQFKEVMKLYGGGSITGYLPYSRMKFTPANVLAEETTTILKLHKSKFSEMDHVSPDLMQAFVQVMTSRVREFTKSQQQDEKMMSLGKLSAGLAHELNNPASSIQRNASSLKKNLEHLPEKVVKLAAKPINQQVLDQVKQFLESKFHENIQLSLMERSELEEEILQWLDNSKIDDPYCVAETFADANIQVKELDNMTKQISDDSLIYLLEWMESTITAKKLVQDIQEASGRITELVNAIKSYSHMDRAPDKQPVLLKEGITNTLAILNHKIKDKQIEVTQHYDQDDLKIPGFPGELNQVWTNIIDNAIDAMENNGKLNISVASIREQVKICFEDNGSGIPEELLNQIFDPFFTTKPIGSGTGLGLDIVKRVVDKHHGKIEVNSKPGKTEFIIWLPKHENI